MLPHDDDNRSDNATTGVPQLRVLIGTFGGQVHLWTPPLTIVTKLGGSAASATEAAAVLHTHGDEVTTVRFGPTGRRAASCGLDGVLLVSDVAKGMQLLRVEHRAAWCCMAWPRELSAAGDVLLLGDDRGAVSVWNMRTGEMETVVDGAFGGECGGLVSAVAACRLQGAGKKGWRSEAAAREHGQSEGDNSTVDGDDDDDDDVLLVVAAGVDYPRDFNVKVFRVV